ncbi:hypothetical protein [Idiomarina ramblicola]|nr:hypothetical protein [Idiomarina ramblicola]
MEFDKDKYKVWRLPHPMLIHWVVNPGVAFNELALGQRIPKITLIDKASDAPLMERQSITMFKRIQEQTHQLGDTQITVSYDRLTSRFVITSGSEVSYSKLLFFIPFTTSKVSISQTIYSVKILSLIIWRAKLLHNGLTVIPELLEKRRSKSIGSLVYSTLMGVLRVFS